MKNRKIYLYWTDFYDEFCPSGMLPEENIRYTPKQGYGVCEIACFLLDEIQYSVNSVNIWINNLTDLANSRAPDGMCGVGNAHWVLITGDYVFIGTEYVEEQQVILTREQLLYVLEQYKAFLEGNYEDPNNPPAPIDVEFIAEGQEAVDLYNSLEGSHQVFYLE